MATHGEGDPTDNALAFYEWIKDKSRDDDELQNVKFTCFGLGAACIAVFVFYLPCLSDR